MNDTIDQKIESSLHELEYHINKLSTKKATLTDYVFPSISITNITTTGDGKKIAQIEIDVRKDAAVFQYIRIDEKGRKEVVTSGNKKFQDINTIKEYWNQGLKSSLNKETLNLSQKAFCLLEFKDNLVKNYQETDKDTVRDIIGVIDELYQKFIRTQEEKNEVDYFPVSMHTLRKRDPELQDVHSIQIMNLLKALFLDPKNYKKILEHEKQGRFDEEIPCRFNILRQIIYE
jgi:hypothetical protein